MGCHIVTCGPQWEVSEHSAFFFHHCYVLRHWSLHPCISGQCSNIFIEIKVCRFWNPEALP